MFKSFTRFFTVSDIDFDSCLHWLASYFAAVNLSVKISLSIERTSPSGNFLSGVILKVFSIATSGPRRPSCLENDVAIDCVMEAVLGGRVLSCFCFLWLVLNSSLPCPLYNPSTYPRLIWLSLRSFLLLICAAPVSDQETQQNTGQRVSQCCFDKRTPNRKCSPVVWIQIVIFQRSPEFVFCSRYSDLGK